MENFSTASINSSNRDDPSIGGAADRCSGQSFVRTGCFVNTDIDSLEQGYSPAWPYRNNKVDRVSDPEKLKAEAEKRGDVVCVSALTGDGLNDFCNAIQEKLKDSMVWVEALIPFDKGELLSSIHQIWMVEKTEYLENGTLVKAYVPLRLARQLTPMRQLCVSS